MPKLTPVAISSAGGLTDVRRLAEMLTRVAGKITHQRLPKVSPLAVPVLLEIGRQRLGTTRLGCRPMITGVHAIVYSRDAEADRAAHPAVGGEQLARPLLRQLVERRL